MHPHIPHWRTLVAACAGALSLALWTTHILLSRRLTPAQLEARRRLTLATQGRIVAGLLLDAQPSEHAPATLFYTYRVAGVTYETSQDVTSFAPRDLRPGLPIQVRYHPANPANSIVLAESWRGL